MTLNLILTKTEIFSLPSQSIIVVINVHLLLHFLLGLHYIKGYYPDVSMTCYSKLELVYYCVLYIMSVFTNCLYLFDNVCIM
jgi:hypothetical protein